MGPLSSPCVQCVPPAEAGTTYREQAGCRHVVPALAGKPLDRTDRAGMEPRNTRNTRKLKEQNYWFPFRVFRLHQNWSVVLSSERIDDENCSLNIKSRIGGWRKRIPRNGAVWKTQAREAVNLPRTNARALIPKGVNLAGLVTPNTSGQPAECG